MGCCNNYQPPLPPSAMGVNPPAYPGPMGAPCCPFKPQVPPVPPMPPKPGQCALPCSMTTFRRVVIPATMGDHTTVPPETLEYRNVILEYEADSYVYIYSSDGIPTLISNGTGTNFNDLTNRPMYNGKEMTGLTNIPEVPTSIAQLSDAARIVCIESTNAALKKQYDVLNNGFVELTQTVDTQGDKLINLANEIERVDCAKQDKLVGEGEGQNIKTVNGMSLVGQGNVEITIESAGVQPLLVSGENIKTINGQDILGAGNIDIEIPDVDLTDYYTKEEVAAELAAKQDTLQSGVNIKTINGQSVLGTGDIELPSAKLYDNYGTATDGALTQNFASTKLQALEAADTSMLASVESLEGRADTIESDIDELQNYAEKTVQTDTKLGTDLTSTVTLIKTTDSINSSNPTDTEIPLPVASATQAGVMNSEMYAQLQDVSNKVEVILGNSTVVPSLPADPTDEQITDAYKEATGQTEVPNGAKLTGPDGKTYIYNATTQKWETFSEGGGAIDVKPFTNESAGTIIGNDVDGGVVSDGGKGLVKGWDTVKADIANNTTALTTAQGDITALQGRMTTAETDINDVKTTAAANTEAINKTNTDLTTLEGRVDANANAITTATGDITSLTNRVSAVETTAGGSATDLTALTNRVTTAEANIAANTALIGDVDSLLQRLDTGAGV